MKKILLLITFLSIFFTLISQPAKNPVRLADSSLVNKYISVNYDGQFTSAPTTITAYKVFDAESTVYTTGTNIKTAGYEYVTLYYSKTASDADNNYFRVSAVATETGTFTYQQTAQSASSGVVTVEANVYELDKAAHNAYFLFPTGGANYLRIDCRKTTDAGTDATITTLISKIPK
jgi:hypothetical protein